VANVRDLCPPAANMVTWSNTDNITTAFTTGAGNYSDTAIAEYLNFIVDQKEKVECELDVASEKMWKMKESFKHIEESKKKMQDKKMQLELYITDIVDDYKNKVHEKKR
jgi:bifunctional N-acetylglucosamine-1-phosphate-uridyltransferase/glucosamine-1-phosphate-acetyltransferase GlmU-like protein